MKRRLLEKEERALLSPRGSSPDMYAHWDVSRYLQPDFSPRLNFVRDGNFLSSLELFLLVYFYCNKSLAILILHLVFDFRIFYYLSTRGLELVSFLQKTAFGGQSVEGFIATTLQKIIY